MVEGGPGWAWRALHLGLKRVPILGPPLALLRHHLHPTPTPPPAGHVRGWGWGPSSPPVPLAGPAALLSVERTVTGSEKLPACPRSHSKVRDPLAEAAPCCPGSFESQEPMVTVQVPPVPGWSSRAQGSPQGAMVQSREKAPGLPTWLRVPPSSHERAKPRAQPGGPRPPRLAAAAAAQGLAQVLLDAQGWEEEEAQWKEQEGQDGGRRLRWSRRGRRLLPPGRAPLPKPLPHRG